MKVVDVFNNTETKKPLKEFNKEFQDLYKQMRKEYKGLYLIEMNYKNHSEYAFIWKKLKSNYFTMEKPRFYFFFEGGNKNLNKISSTGGKL
jgi:hypothetical protein